MYLLRKSYALIYQLLLTSEPVSEALLPIYNQLTTLRKCLLEVKKLGGVSSPRELYPYSMKGYSPHLLTLLDARIKVCEETLAELKLNLSELTPELTPKWEKLVSILRSLCGCNARSKVSEFMAIP